MKLGTIVFIGAMHVGYSPFVSAQVIEEWRAVPALRVGALDDSVVAFSSIVDLTVDRSGNIYVAQWQGGRITVLQADGTPSGRIGRLGRGPGEFVSPARLGWLGDSLIVYDPAQSRLTLFEPKGILIRTVPIRPPPLSDFHTEIVPFGFTPDGLVLAEARAFATFVKAGVNENTPLVRFAVGAGAVDTLAWVNVLNTHAQSKLRDGRTVMTFQPFSDASLFAASRDARSLVIVDRSVRHVGFYIVTRMNSRGDTVFSRRFSYKPIKLDRKDIDSVVVTRSQFLTGGGYATPATARDIVRQSLFIPASFPPVSALVVGRDGAIWLRGPDLRRALVSWYGLSTEGVPIARVMLPRGVKLLEVTASRMYGVINDEMDVPYVVAYELKRPTTRARN